MATWKSAAYDGRYLQLDISESVNVVGNSSTLSWTLTSTGGASTYYTIDTTTVTINGTTVYSKDRTYWDDRVFPAKKGSVSGTITVAHNSNGSKTIAVGFSTRVYIYGSQEYGGSMTLTTIDRSAPTVTFSTSNVTANGFKISATSSATADIWQYSTNGGSSWTQFSTTASTSASVTLSSLSPNTSYTVRVRARRQYNHVYGTSGSSTVKTLGGAVVNSVNTVTADNATVSITINVTVYEASYNEFIERRPQGDSMVALQEVLEDLRQQEQELAELMMQRLITKAAYEEERKSVKMQITDISEKISERRAKRVPESEYVPITEFSEEKAKRFLSKVVVTMFTVTFVFYNGAKITRIYDNGQPGNKVGWNKKKEES